jgi:hypothetical protein
MQPTSHIQSHRLIKPASRKAARMAIVRGASPGNAPPTRPSERLGAAIAPTRQDRHDRQDARGRKTRKAARSADIPPTKPVTCGRIGKCRTRLPAPLPPHPAHSAPPPPRTPDPAQNAKAEGNGNATVTARPRRRTMRTQATSPLTRLAGQPAPPTWRCEPAPDRPQTPMNAPLAPHFRPWAFTSAPPPLQGFRKTRPFPFTRPACTSRQSPVS